MIITGYSVEPVQIVYRAPIQTSTDLLSARTILYIRLTSGIEQSIGEVSPLIWEHTGAIEKSMSQCLEFLKLLKQNVVEYGFTPETFYSLTEAQNLNASILSGLEQAYFGLYAKTLNTSIRSIYGIGHIEELEVNALIGVHNPQKTIELCKKCWEHGYRTIKLKVGNLLLYNELELLTLIRNQLPPSLKIRLDANGIFDLSEAKLRLKAYEQFAIEYIEQPLREHGDFHLLREHTEIPLAVDESITSVHELEQVAYSDAIDYYIIKPAQLGMLRDILPVIREIETIGKGVVVTHSLESPVGRNRAIVCAAACLFKSAHGLGIVETTGGEENLFYPVVNGKITFENLAF